MDSVTKRDTLLSASAMTLHTDEPCWVSSVRVTGAELVSAHLGQLDALGRNWLPGVPLAVVLEPEQVGGVVVVEVERSEAKPEAAEAFSGALKAAAEKAADDETPESHRKLDTPPPGVVLPPESSDTEPPPEPTKTDPSAI